MLAFFSPIVLNAVKTVHLPKEIKVEENVFTETVVRNLSAEGIYKADQCTIIGDYIYMGQERPVEVVKISLNGKVVGRFGREGQGPGEFIWIDGIRQYKENIAIMESKINKIVICTDKFQLVSEHRLKNSFSNFLVDKKGQFIFFGNLHDDYYFSIYSNKYQYICKFAKKLTTSKQRMKRVSFDILRHGLYIEEEDGIWAAFRNRYDLRYYKNWQFFAEIKAPQGFFKGESQMIGGREVIMYSDIAIFLARFQKELFYFYRFDGKLFCDVFDLKDCHLLRRIKLKYNYFQVAYQKEKTFYALTYADNEENDVLLYRLEFK